MESIWKLLFQSSSRASSDDLVPPPQKQANFDASSSTQEPQQALHRNLTQINDSVFEVDAPQDRRPSVEVVFFHGLQVDGFNKEHVTTWKSRDKSELWLDWILEKIPNARILTISYDAHARRTAAEGVMDMDRIRENLVTDLVDAEVGQDGCPVVLVGHCVGGLVMKEVCVEANSKLSLYKAHESDVDKIRVENFLHHLKGLFFYASPHHGTKLAEQSTSSSRGLLFEDVSTNKNQAARRNECFRKLRKKYGWRSFGLVEGRESHVVSPYLGTFTGFVVTEASARNDVDGFYTDTTADHFQVCQPHSRKSSSFKRLSDFISEVVEEDSKARQGHNIGFPDKVIGLQRQVEVVLKQLKKTPRLGIVGMGGIGKTTLAKTVYNAISWKFEYTCFLSEVKKLFADEETEEKLRATIVKDLYCKGRKVPEEFRWNTLKGKSVLIVLDDAKTGSQVRVMTNSDGFLEESRVIVTSREQRFLKVEVFECHFALELNDDDSRKLFCLHAFRTTNAPTEFEEHVGRMLSKCRGLPLALKVAGRYLYASPKRDWVAALEKLSLAQPLTGTPDDVLSSVLRVSYDSLSQPERELFLDVATFFHSQSLNTAKKIWVLCGWQGVECSWRNLLDKGLVTQMRVVTSYQNKSQYGIPHSVELSFKKMGKLGEWKPHDEQIKDYIIIQMHEMLRDLGHSMACPDPRNVVKHTRASYSVFNPRAFGAPDQGQPELEVLNISNLRRDGCSEGDSPTLNVSTFDGLNNLRILSLDGGKDSGVLQGPLHLFPSRLTYLKVRRIKISSCLTQTSSDKSEQHRTLQYLEIEDCSDFSTRPSSLEQLHDLKHLTISWCYSLKVLPSLRGLQALEHLTIQSCHDLKVIPECLGELQALKYLRISQCSYLSSLPNSVGKLRALQHLEIMACWYLTVPHALGKLENLQHLKIMGCRGLGTLGNVIGQLKSLRHLEVMSPDGCDVPLNNLGRLEALEYLKIFESWSKKCFWEAFPNGLGELKSLKQLWLNGTQGLKALPKGIEGLRTLESLWLEGCCSLETLPETLGELKSLKQLWLIGTQGLKALPKGIEGLRTLESLWLEGCWSLETLPETLGQLQVLETLVIESRKLETLPYSLGQLHALKYLHIAAPLKALPSTIGSLQALEYLHLESSSRNVAKIETLPDALGELRALRYLGLTRLQNLKSLPESLGRLPALEHLMYACDGQFLRQLVGKLQVLEELEIECSDNLRALPDTVGALKSLKRLELRFCWELETIPDSLGQFESLEQLEIGGCPNLKDLPQSLKQRGFTKRPGL